MNIANSTYNRLNSVYSMLKYAYGLILLLIGLDKVLALNLIVHWQIYLSPLAQEYLFVQLRTFWIIFGCAEIITGLLILSKFTRLGAYIAAAVLVTVIINLLSMKMYYDIAARDAVIAIGALALGKLDQIIEEIKSKNK